MENQPKPSQIIPGHIDSNTGAAKAMPRFPWLKVLNLKETERSDLMVRCAAQNDTCHFPKRT